MTMVNNKNVMWTVKKPDGIIYGPADTETIKKWIQEERVLPEDHISPESLEEWKPTKSLAQFANLFDLKSDGINHEKGTNRNFVNADKPKTRLLNSDIILFSFILVLIVIGIIYWHNTVGIFFGICIICAIIAVLFGIRRKQKTGEEKSEFIENKEIAKERPLEGIVRNYAKKNGREVKITSSLGFSAIISIITLIIVFLISVGTSKTVFDTTKTLGENFFGGLLVLLLFVLPACWLFMVMFGPFVITTVTGICPYCGTMIATTCDKNKIRAPYSFTCGICRELIILEEGKFFKKDDIVS